MPNILWVLVSVVPVLGTIAMVYWYGQAPNTKSRSSALILNGQALMAGEGSRSLAVDGVDTVFRGVEQLAFTIETGRVRLYETVDGCDLADFGLVQMVSFPRPTASLVNAIADYLRHNGVRAVNMNGVRAPTKLFQYVRFAQAGLPVPTTFYLPRPLLGDSFACVADKLGLPFILKSMSASGGRYNFLVGDERQLADHLLNTDHAEVRFVVQEFIPNDSTFRLLVLGGEVSVVTRHVSVGATYVANAVQRGRVDLLDRANLDPAVKRLAVQAAALVGCEVAAVNVIQHWTSGQWYVLDINPTPALGTGTFVEDKLEAYSSYLRRRLVRP